LEREKLAEEARKLYEAGLPVKEIMQRLGVRSYSTFYELIGQMRRVSRRPRRKLSEEEIAKICEELKAKSVYSVAKEFGLSTSRVYSIKKKCP